LLARCAARPLAGRNISGERVAGERIICGPLVGKHLVVKGRRPFRSLQPLALARSLTTSAAAPAATAAAAAFA